MTRPIDPTRIARARDIVRQALERGEWPLDEARLNAIASEFAPAAGPATVDVIRDDDGGFAIRVIRRVTRPDPLAILSPREREVAQLAARGLTNREIAGRLRISAATVKDHMSHVLERTGLRRRVELAALVAPSAAAERSPGI
jgi:DNA-binding NarL/FixJ family response regulator